MGYGGYFLAEFTFGCYLIVDEGDPFRLTAAATTGPASGPRPTSSTPAMRRHPCCHSLSSSAKVGA